MASKGRSLPRTDWLKLLLVAVTCLPTVAICRNVRAEIVVDVGMHQLLPDTGGQPIDIFIRSTDPIADPFISGLNLNVEIGDGTGSESEPVFQGMEGTRDGIDFSGSIFAGNPASGSGPANRFPQLVSAGIVSEGNLDPNGILVSLLIDTTGFSDLGQTFDLRLGDHLSPFPIDTQILGPLGNAFPIQVTINNGLLAIGETTTALAGDYNGDTRVDAADYTIWRDTLDQQVVAGTGADGEPDGLIDTLDYNIWKQNFGSESPASLAVVATPIPEPASLSLGFFSVLLAFASKTQRLC